GEHLRAELRAVWPVSIQDRMEVRATEAVRTHGAPLALPEPRRRFRSQDEGARLRAVAAVRRDQLRRRGEDTVVQCLHDLDQPSDPGRALGVTDLTLDRA